MPLTKKLTPAQVTTIAQLTNSNLDSLEQKSLISVIDALFPVAATTTEAGTVSKAATVANAVAAIPAAAPTGGVGAAAGGWDTAANRDAAIVTINGLRTAVTELQTKLNAVFTSMRTAGQIV